MTNRTNTLNENLIISTKSASTGRKVAIVISSSVIILLGIICFFIPGAFKSINRQWGPLLGYACGILMIAYSLFEIMLVFFGTKSYCAVYENGISGITAFGIGVKEPQQAVSLSFNEIENVSMSGKSIIVYTKFGKFLFSALKNGPEAVQAIRRGMQELS